MMTIIRKETAEVLGCDFYSIACIVIETAHQWFGDLVTPLTWDHIWLSESFATFFQDKINNVSMGQSSCRRDAMRSEIRYPIRLVFQDVFDPLVQPGFGLIYTKGCAILHMAESLFGEENFRMALQAYVRKYAGNNADTDRFLAELDKVALSQNIEIFKNVKPSVFLKGFLYNLGFPILTVQIHGSDAILSQKSGFGAQGKSDTWAIPVWYRIKSKNVIEGPIWLKDNVNITISDVTRDSIEWDPDNIGYYQTEVLDSCNGISFSGSPNAFFIIVVLTSVLWATKT